METLSLELVKDVLARVSMEINRHLEMEKSKDGMALIKMEAILKNASTLKHSISVTVETRFEIAVGANLQIFMNTLYEYVLLAKTETSAVLEEFAQNY